MKARIALIILYPILFCCSMFWTPLASVYRPFMVINLKPWTILLYVVYGFLFMLPQLGLVAGRIALQKSRKKRA